MRCEVHEDHEQFCVAGEPANALQHGVAMSELREKQDSPVAHVLPVRQDEDLCEHPLDTRRAYCIATKVTGTLNSHAAFLLVRPRRSRRGSGENLTVTGI
jgi:hypothetical protein